MHKYSIKLILYTYQPKNGLFPIYLRIIVDGKTSYLSTNHCTSESDWDEKKEKVKTSHPTHHIINPEISDVKNRALDIIVKLQVNKKIFTAQQITKTLKYNRNENNIFEFAEILFESISSKKAPGTLVMYRRHMSILKKFNKGSGELNFEQIDYEFLSNFEMWLKDNDNIKHKKENTDNYTYCIFQTLKRVFNAAKKKKIIDCYPFDDYDNPKYSSPQKKVLSKEELKRWEENINSWDNNLLNQTSIYFLLGCYSGLRVSDWYMFDIEKNVVGKYIKLRPKKTEKHQQWITMPISAPLKRLLPFIKNTPLTADEKILNKNVKKIAKKLQIKKYLTTHTGRHTFAVTICLENRITSETAAELMGINLLTFINNYSQVTPEKIERETREAWANLS